MTGSPPDSSPVKKSPRDLAESSECRVHSCVFLRLLSPPNRARTTRRAPSWLAACCCIVERSGARFRSRVRPSGRRLGVFDRVAMQALPVGVRGWRAGVAMGCMPAAHQLWRQGGVVGTWVYNARACCVVCDTVSSGVWWGKKERWSHWEISWYFPTSAPESRRRRRRPEGA